MNSINKNLSSVIKTGVFDHEDDSIMYVLINKDIKMDISGLISQCCNSIIKIIRLNESRYNQSISYYDWTNSDEKKVYLKATQEDLLYAINNYSSK